MDRLIYTALTGMRSRQAAQAVTANNLANAATTGFRRELSSLASRYLGGANDTTRVESDDAVTTASLEPGHIVETGQSLDVAVRGSGWIAVQAADGAEAYTRRGDLRVAPGGQLQTGDGHAVIGSGGEITLPPSSTPSIAADGTVSIHLPGASAATIVDRIKLVDPAAATLQKDSAGLFRSSDAVDTSAEVQLQPGALESANVDSARGLVELIEQSRGFEVNAKLLSAARDMDEAGARLMRADN
ncbi:MAG: flagellar basal body rod protein FlgF [Janthinobacterium lividum]